MKTVTEHLWTHLHRSFGLFEVPKCGNLDELYRTEWSSKFAALMQNRLVQGYFRYGPMDPKTKKQRYDNIRSAQERLDLYRNTGNQEHLVDAANLCLLEYVVPGSHPNPHWSTTDDGVHTTESVVIKKT